MEQTHPNHKHQEALSIEEDDNSTEYGSITTSTGKRMELTSPHISNGKRCPSLERIRDSIVFTVAAGGMILYCVYIARGQKELLTFTLLTTVSLCCFFSIPVFRPNYVNLAETKVGNKCKRFFRGGDVNFTILSLIFVAMPCFLFLSKAFSRHMNGSFTFTSSTHIHLANDLGKLSVYAMSFFLIPVSRQSILLKSLQLSPSHAVKLHTFAGYIALGGGLAHGLYWIWIWFFVMYLAISDILPGADCWNWGDESSACQQQFVNALGIFCGLCFIMLGLSSMWWVRRNHYRVFYTCHAVFSVAIFFGLLMHYKKMIWYLAPSIIYYLASSVPVLVRAVQNYAEGGTLMTNAAAIPGSRGCVEMTMKYSESSSKARDILRLTCGSYVRINVPEISSIWHPFTVFASASTPDEMKLIFRVSGPFTTSLSKRIVGSPTTSHEYPKVLVDGMYGNPNQLRHAFSHETVFIVAGGVGIVSYISLLQSIRTHKSFDEVHHLTGAEMLPKQIVVHWICRDEGLINHIVDEYLSGYWRRPQIQIIIHHTTKDNLDVTFEEERINGSTNPLSDDFVDHERAVRGKPFIPTMPGNNVQNLLLFINFSAIGWGSLWVVHYCYNTFQAGRTVYRSLVIFGILVLAIVCSVLTALVAKLLWYSDINTYNMIESRTKTDLCDSGTDISSDGTNVEESGHMQLQIEHCRGRPSTQAIVERTLESSDNIGVFICGPTMLHEAIRTCVDKRECSLCPLRRVSIYEEVFEL